MTWIMMALAGGTLLLLAILMAWILGWANKALAVKSDPKVAAIEKILPGANCGGCGYVGCREYAEAVPKGESITKCTVGGSGCAGEIADVMGVDVKETWPYRPVVHCEATIEDRLQRHEYRGEQTCSAANLVAGVQGCTYGCLGIGDCVTACKYDAIRIVQGLAVVDYEKCTGCGACAKVCPRNIINMVPFKTERMLVVKCCNKDSGKDVKAVCKVGCISCGICAKNCPLFKLVDNVPTIDYDAYDPATADFSTALQKCPRESLVWVGKPTEKDKAAVAGEELPERVEGDPKTTVDDAEWRG